jgi:cytochrome c oxidase subunit 2
LAAPSLTGVNDWYLVTQLKNYRDGTRGGSAGDDYGAQMRAAARILINDQAIFDVVSYVSTLPSQQEK